MKLLRYGDKGQEKPGLLDAQGNIRDLSAHIADVAGAALSAASLETLSKIDPASLPLVSGSPRIGACVGQVGKFICIGLNYADHAAESGLAVPSEPVVFSKWTSAICGPNDNVEIPRDSTKTDWEVELGVVIGKGGRNIDEHNALEHVAGYCVINDVSERDWQLKRNGQWCKGKSFDGFGPLGPWLVTRDELPDPQTIALELAINGQTMQKSSTADMIFTVAEIVSHLSQFMTLLPGDVVITGTPAGVGMGQKPVPRFLRRGDVITLAGGPLGAQRQQVR